MAAARYPHPLLWGLAAAAGCTFGVNPNQPGRFSCTTDKDCGNNWQCVTQAKTGRGLCFPNGMCTPEVCNGLDDDCDGVVDNGIDLSTDNLNCGMCGNACPTGTTCTAAVCIETDCSDGIDNDHNGLTDCADPHCRGLACSATDAGVNCGTAWRPVDAGPVDAGSPDAGADAGLRDGGGDGGADAGPTDGGGADAGTDAGVDAGVDAGGVDGGYFPVPACVPRESICFDGIDNDGDGLTDCADPDCDGKICGPGKVCTGGTCP